MKKALILLSFSVMVYSCKKCKTCNANFEGKLIEEDFCFDKSTLPKNPSKIIKDSKGNIIVLTFECH